MDKSFSYDASSAGQLALARSGVYGLLAHIYRDPPSVDFLRQLTDPLFHSALSELGINLSPELTGNPDALLMENLSVEFTRLFIGPGKHISPHGSVHRNNEGDLWGQSTADVKYFIENCGYVYNQAYSGLPDHISVEFEFMSTTGRQEADAWQEGNLRLVNSSRKVQKIFFTEHLLSWVPQFCNKIIEAAKLPFYHEMGRLTGHFMEYEREALSRWPTSNNNALLRPSPSFAKAADGHTF